MKALLVRSETDYNTSIKKLMNASYSNIELLELDNSHQLIDILASDGPFSFVIIDIDNKNLIAKEIYETIIEIIGPRPFVFIGNQNSVKAQLNDQIISNTQLNFLVESPISSANLQKAIDQCKEWARKEEFESSIIELSKDDLQKMRLKNFQLFDQAPYDAYLELTNTKFGKVLSKNKPFSHQLIQNYAKKNVKYFYLRKDEHLEFLSQSIKNLTKIYGLHTIEQKKLISIHLKTIFFIHQYINAVSVTDEIIQLTDLYIASVKDIIKSSNYYIPSILDSVSDYNNMTFAEQSVLTSYVAEAMVHQIGWNADMSREKLILASILQDINLPNDELIKIRVLNDPNLKVFPEEDQISFKNHPYEAAKISTFFQGYSDVDFILEEHHEHPTGGGFPKGLNATSLTTISCIFIIATNFISRLSCLGKKDDNSYLETINNMKKVYSVGNFKDPMKALEKSIKK